MQLVAPLLEEIHQGRDGTCLLEHVFVVVRAGGEMRQSEQRVAARDRRSVLDEAHKCDDTAFLDDCCCVRAAAFGEGAKNLGDGAMNFDRRRRLFGKPDQHTHATALHQSCLILDVVLRKSKRCADGLRPDFRCPCPHDVKQLPQDLGSTGGGMLCFQRCAQLRQRSCGGRWPGLAVRRRQAAPACLARRLRRLLWSRQACLERLAQPSGRLCLCPRSVHLSAAHPLGEAHACKHREHAQQVRLASVLRLRVDLPLQTREDVVRAGAQLRIVVT
mmetsp:Transcript_89441/g.289305  ORF Transcript_89441/g.289305 Transcript_89441/m.289305 type:complete len:274 (+) Transcript_89441:430-1251(+)